MPRKRQSKASQKSMFGAVLTAAGPMPHSCLLSCVWIFVMEHNGMPMSRTGIGEIVVAVMLMP